MIFWEKQPGSVEEVNYNIEPLDSHGETVKKVFGKYTLIDSNVYMVYYKGVNIVINYAAREPQGTHFVVVLSMPGFDGRELTCNDYSLGILPKTAEAYFKEMYLNLVKEKEEIEQRLTRWGGINSRYWSLPGQT